MDSFVIDSEILIGEVEKQPCLYDTNCTDYHDKNKKTKAWDDICKSMVPLWDTGTITEKNNLGRDIQKRWRSLRDSFIKAIKIKNNRTGHSKRRQYIYYKQMSFLIPTLRRNPISENASTDMIEETVGIYANEKEINCQEQTLGASKSQVTEPNPPRSNFMKPLPKKRQKNDTFESSLLKILSENRKKQKEEEDPDRMFLLSLLPAFKGISQDEKCLAQIEMLQTIRKYSKPHPPLTVKVENAYSVPIKEDTEISNRTDVLSPFSQSPSTSVHSSSDDDESFFVLGE